MSRYVKTVAAADGSGGGGGGGGGGSTGISLTQACTAACCVIAGYAGTAFNCGSQLRTPWQLVYACNCWNCSYGSQWIEMILPTTKYCAFCIVWNGIMAACYACGVSCWAFGTQNYFQGKCCGYCQFGKQAAYYRGWSPIGSPYSSNCYTCLNTNCNNECHGGFFGWHMCIHRAQGYGDYLCSTGNTTWNSNMFDFCINQTSMCAAEMTPGSGCCTNWGRINDYCYRACGGSGMCWSSGINVDGSTITEACECCGSGNQFSRFRWRHNNGVIPFMCNAQGNDAGANPSWYIFGLPWRHAGGTCCEDALACTETDPQFLFYPGQTICKDY
tara:strand:- start:1327 stop:2313 length:987 start_codon:yes stop_codon:yes gene_type:complete